MSYHLISQLSHVELITPKPDESVRFFKDVLGLQESHREGQSVWLRAWGEFFHHSLKLTEGPEPMLGHAAWRVDGPDDLELAARALIETGVDGEWIDGDVGHGKAYQYTVPGGHRFELVWDVERYIAPPDQRSVYPSRPQKQVAMNATVRRLDHVTVISDQPEADRQVFVDGLKFRHMDSLVLPNGKQVFSALTSGAHNHDLAILATPPGYQGSRGQVHHTCFFYDTREELLRALDILAEHGFKTIDFTPHQHGIGELFFAYILEPGGNRIELQSAGVWNYMPDWEPVMWQLDQGGGMAWSAEGAPLPEELLKARARVNGAGPQTREAVRHG